MKNFLFFSLISFFLLSGFVFAQDSEVLNLDLFYSPTCPHCQAENKFLDNIEGKYEGLIINRYVAADPKNLDLLLSLAKKYGAEKHLGGVPLTFLGEDFFIGYNSGIGDKIEKSIERQLKFIPESDNGGFKIPLLDRFNLDKYSLPTLAIIFGFIDGFNICSLGALALILGLVLALRSRKKFLFMEVYLF